jgi:hypothetical protein
MSKHYIIERAKSRLGSPTMNLELDDKIVDALFDEASSTFLYYYQLSKAKENSVFQNITDNSLSKIETSWVCRYFTALLKEALGNVRGKFGGEINVPGGPFKLEYSHLLRESESEKISLIKDIYPHHEYSASPFALLGVYVNIGNLDTKDAEAIMDKVSHSFSETLPKYIKTVIMPSRVESKIEVVYSNNSNKEIDFELLEQLKDLDKELEKYIKDEE